MDLHLKHFSVIHNDKADRVAVQSLDRETTRGVIDLVWDWLEAITRDEYFDVLYRMLHLQEMFRASAYGGPTSYAILRSAYHKGIPAFWLPDERLMQYGYGKYQVRGVSTTFDRDSHLDSDFTTQKDDCKAFLAHRGFPVPQGDVVYNLDDARDAAYSIGYPVAVKPVAGHKGKGVTANIQNSEELGKAFHQALEASPDNYSPIIVEKYISGSDFRLLCVGGKFVAGLERRPPFVVGDGNSSISELIKPTFRTSICN
jgi:cyanophycin synthetase